MAARARSRRSEQRTDGRPDARTERWREHRSQVREEFVTAAFRALGKIGPDVSMDDIAKEAGASKPKLYRYFKDKVELFDAIVDRVQDMLWERVLWSINLMSDSTGDLVRRGATEYAKVVTEYPNVFRFMVHSHFTQQMDESGRTLQSARQSARRAANLFSDAFDGDTIDDTYAELTVYSVFGAVASATDWWLGANPIQGDAMPIEKFIDYLAATVSSIAESAARLIGFTVDPTLPLHLAFSNTNTTGEDQPGQGGTSDDA
ncbi:TetR/AcrR family transcriptional regulator [Mycolicibacterium komossense]|uniref:TetR/AcrR family transcriptional regulator n=1 Tax=Mycolicibacterium komossense TaxID=1779 RepID=A0ABT3CG33_9MYCO|nr:TetR/AcrR family transcriptional regulator [Mycolicibacterium komossense]MCV7228379.1 TetR/AcrR family transcriptional regulator [Mycolicibacterium komossense]